MDIKENRKEAGKAADEKKMNREPAVLPVSHILGSMLFMQMLSQDMQDTLLSVLTGRMNPADAVIKAEMLMRMTDGTVEEWEQMLMGI